MTTLPNLHDGFFDGVWLSADKQARLFVRSVSGEHSTIQLTDVEALNISSVKRGNIIFDVELIPPDKVTTEDIKQVYDLKDDQAEMARQLLAKAQQQNLSALEITSSYGAEGKVLFRTIDMFPQHVLD